MRILLVNYSKISNALRNYLLEDNIDCDLALDSDLALAKIKKSIKNSIPYHLIFLFDLLPGSNILNTLARIKALEKKGQILRQASVIVVITDQDYTADHWSEIKESCDFCLRLPLNTLKLAMILEATQNKHWENKLPTGPQIIPYHSKEISGSVLKTGFLEV